MYLRKRELFMLMYWVSRLEESGRECCFIGVFKSIEILNIKVKEFDSTVIFF